MVIYFAGGTDVFGDMALIRRLHRPEIAVLPVGDRATVGPEGAAVALEPGVAVAVGELVGRAAAR